jgi:hypothetical protein
MCVSYRVVDLAAIRTAAQSKMRTSNAVMGLGRPADPYMTSRDIGCEYPLPDRVGRVGALSPGKG